MDLKKYGEQKKIIKLSNKFKTNQSNQNKLKNSYIEIMFK
jgi:hypothetical protein